MKKIDRLLQRWRLGAVGPWLPAKGRVLDIGCHDGALIRALGQDVDYVGIDPYCPAPGSHDRRRLIRGSFPDDLEDPGPFDCIACLATLEHVPLRLMVDFGEACLRLLEPGGRMVLTIPSPAVDPLLGLLRALRLLDGMSVEQHQGSRVETVLSILCGLGFRQVHHKRFQGGLNHLVVLIGINA